MLIFLQMPETTVPIRGPFDEETATGQVWMEQAASARSDAVEASTPDQTAGNHVGSVVPDAVMLLDARAQAMIDADPELKAGLQACRELLGEAGAIGVHVSAVYDPDLPERGEYLSVATHFAGDATTVMNRIIQYNSAAVQTLPRAVRRKVIVRPVHVG